MNITKNEITNISKAYDLLNALFIILTPRLDLEYANDTAKKNLDLPEADISQRNFLELWNQLGLTPFLNTEGHVIYREPIKVNTSYLQWKCIKAKIDGEKKFFLIGKNVTKQEKIFESLEKACENIFGYKFNERYAPAYYVTEVYNYLSGIINKIPCYVYWKNKSLQYIGCNQMAANFINLESPEEIIGKTDFDIFSDWGLAKEYRDTDEQIFATGKAVINQPGELINNEGKIIHTLVSKIPICNQAGEIMGLAGISVDVTDLRNAQESAELANQVKTEFIANMSHDIRTPLTGVVGMSKLLEDNLPDPNQKQYAHWLGESGKQLLHMLNGILDVVSADNVNEADMHEEPFNLVQVIQDIEQLERPSTLIKGLKLITSVDPAIPSCLIGDSTKIHRILLNLLGNAIKFTEEGQVGIYVQLLKQDDHCALVQFRITDTGIGIPKELQNKVFDRFYRVTPSDKGTYTGHGVGLHIAQSYVSLLGGEISLTSDLGIGTTFQFDLSFKIGNGMHKTMAPRSDEEKSTMPLPAVGKEEELILEKPKLLLVEDNKIALFTLENLVIQSGCQFTSVMDGETALHLAQSEVFSLIITDLGLPGLSGKELTQKIRLFEKENQLTPVPIIGLTAHSEEKIKKNCLLSGMDEVYTKPMTIEVLAKIKKKYLVKNIASVAPLSPSGLNLGCDLPATEKQLFELESFPLFNMNSALQSMGNDINLLKSILKSLIEKETPLDLIELEKARLSGDWTTVEKLAHRMKSGFVYCGAEKLVHACQYLERYHKAGHTHLLEPLYQQMLDVIEETRVFVHSWLANFSNH